MRICFEKRIGERKDKCEKKLWKDRFRIVVRIGKGGLNDKMEKGKKGQKTKRRARYLGSIRAFLQ